MANTTFLDLPSATSLDGTEVLPIVQPANSTAGVSKRVTTGQIAQLASAGGNPPSSTFITVTQNPALVNSRVLAVDPDLQLTDSGALGTMTVGPISTGAVTYAKFQQTPPFTLLANGSSGTATIGSVALGAALTLNTATLVVTTNGIVDSLIRQGGPLTVIGRSANSTGNVADIAGTAANQALMVNPGGTGLVFSAINVSSLITGVLQVPNGGTGNSSLTAFGVLIGNGTSALSITAAGTSGAILTGQTSTSAPQFKSVVGDISLTAGGTATIASAAVTYAKFQNVPPQTIIVNGSSTTGSIMAVPVGGAFSLTTASFVIANNAISDPLIRQGGPLTVIGRASNSTGNVADIAASAADQVLLVNSGGTGLAFGQINASTAVTGVIQVPNGGTGNSSLTAFGVLVGNGTNPLSITAAGTAGAILTGQTSTSAPQFKSVVGDLSLSAAGTATIASNAVSYAKFQQTPPTTLVGNSAGTTGNVGTVSLGGAFSFSGSTLIIATNSIDNTLIRQSGPLSVVGRSANSTGNVADISGTTNQVLVVNSGGTGLAFGAVNAAATAAFSGNLRVTQFNSGTSASSATFWAGDGTWRTPAGGGNVSGPVSSTNNAIVKWNGTAGTTVSDSDILVTTGTLSRTGGIAVQATNTNDSASSGYIGEYLSQNVPLASIVPLTNNTPINIAALALTAGDWDVSGNIVFVGGGGTTTTLTLSTIGTTSGTLPTSPDAGARSSWVGSVVGGGTPVQPTGDTRISVASTTTAYLIAYSSFSGGTSSAYGFIGARRAR